MDEIFNRLREWSEREDSYSIRDFAKEINMPYVKLLELSKKNEDWERDFNIARCKLAVRAEESSMSKKITLDEGARYAYENDFFLRDYIEKGESIKIPEDPEKFDKWFDKRLAKENAELEALNKRRSRR